MADKVVAVTGGSGGLGGAIVARLAETAERVFVLDLPNTLEVTPRSAKVASVAVDVSSEESVQAAFAQVAGETGRLDGLVVAAGIQLHGRDNRAGEVPLDVWQETMAVNLTGAFLTIKYALPLLVAAGRSSVVLIGSPTGLTMSGAGYTAYAASKAGMMALGRVLAADYAGVGVRANVVVPGTMRTPLIEPLLADPQTRRGLLHRLPIGRLGEAADLTGLVGWLVSDDAGFATGGFFPVDGGLTAG